MIKLCWLTALYSNKYYDCNSNFKAGRRSLIITMTVRPSVTNHYLSIKASYTAIKLRKENVTAHIKVLGHIFHNMFYL